MSENANPSNTANPFASELVAPIEDDPGSLENIGELEEKTESEEIPEDQIPVRLRGKPVQEIYREFAGLEKDYSRMGNELGEARALLRETLEKALSAAKHAESKSEEPTDDDFVTNPKEAVKRLIESAVKPVKEATATADQRAMMIDFNNRHPGYQEIAKSHEFQKWVGESSYRTRMFKSASAFDMDAAEDLFTMWKETKPSSSPSKKDELKGVSTETGGAGKSASKGGKKIYKSADLMRLFNEDRERYNSESAEIELAFIEGRVR